MDIDRLNAMQRSDNDLLDIAAHCLGTDRGQLTPPERIKGGITNESWLIRSASEALVVRVSNDSTALQIDRLSEAAILVAVADAAIGAPVLLCKPDDRLLVTKYIAGRVWTARDTRAPENIERMAALLRRLHALPIPVQARYIDLWKVVHG